MNKLVSLLQTKPFYRAELDLALITGISQILPTINAIAPFSNEGESADLIATNKILGDLATVIRNSLNPSIQKYYSKGNEHLLKVSINEIFTSVSYSLMADELPFETHHASHQLLTRTIFNIGRNFIVNFEAIVSRIHVNLPEISSLFFANDPINLQNVEFTNSDPHNAGKRVAIITFENGKKLVYKPRDIRADTQIVGAGSSVSSMINTARLQTPFKSELAPKKWTSRIDRLRRTRKWARSRKNIVQKVSALSKP